MQIFIANFAFLAALAIAPAHGAMAWRLWKMIRIATSLPTSRKRRSCMSVRIWRIACWFAVFLSLFLRAQAVSAADPVLHPCLVWLDVMLYVADIALDTNSMYTFWRHSDWWFFGITIFGIVAGFLTSAVTAGDGVPNIIQEARRSLARDEYTTGWYAVKIGEAVLEGSLSASVQLYALLITPNMTVFQVYTMILSAFSSLRTLANGRAVSACMVTGLNSKELSPHAIRVMMAMPGWSLSMALFYSETAFRGITIIIAMSILRPWRVGVALMVDAFVICRWCWLDIRRNGGGMPVFFLAATLTLPAMMLGFEGTFVCGFNSRTLSAVQWFPVTIARCAGVFVWIWIYYPDDFADLYSISVDWSDLGNFCLKYPQSIARVLTVFIGVLSGVIYLPLAVYAVFRADLMCYTEDHPNYAAVKQRAEQLHEALIESQEGSPAATSAE